MAGRSEVDLDPIVRYAIKRLSVRVRPGRQHALLEFPIMMLDNEQSSMLSVPRPTSVAAGLHPAASYDATIIPTML